MTTEIPIAGGRDGACRQSPCGAGVIAPASPPLTADAATMKAASDFLASVEIKDGSVWTLARTTILVQLWFQGLSTREIGLALRVTKNAIVGQAHRIELPGRPSPIPGRITARQALIPCPTPPPLPSLEQSPPVEVCSPTLPPPPPQPPPPTPEARAVRAPPVARVARTLPPLPREQPFPPPRTAGCAPPVRLVPPPPPPTVFRGRALTPCCWPFGDPGTKSFRFCGDPSLPGKPYCPTHLRKAYVPVPRKETRCA